VGGQAVRSEASGRSGVQRKTNRWPPPCAGALTAQRKLTTPSSPGGPKDITRPHAPHGTCTCPHHPTALSLFGLLYTARASASTHLSGHSSGFYVLCRMGLY